MQQYLANIWVYRELIHSVREAMTAWYCSVLIKSINCTLQSSSCRFSNSRALSNSIVRIISIIARSPKAIAPTISIHAHHPISIVRAVPINRQPVKTIFKTIPINSLRDHLSGQFQLKDNFVTLLQEHQSINWSIVRGNIRKVRDK